MLAKGAGEKILLLARLDFLGYDLFWQSSKDFKGRKNASKHILSALRSGRGH